MICLITLIISVPYSNKKKLSLAHKRGSQGVLLRRSWRPLRTTLWGLSDDNFQPKPVTCAMSSSPRSSSLFFKVPRSQQKISLKCVTFEWFLNFWSMVPWAIFQTNIRPRKNLAQYISLVNNTWGHCAKFKKHKIANASWEPLFVAIVYQLIFSHVLYSRSTLLDSDVRVYFRS